MPSKSTSYRDTLYRLVEDIAEEQGESFSHVANSLIDRGAEAAGLLDERVMEDGVITE